MCTATGTHSVSLSIGAGPLSVYNWWVGKALNFILDLCYENVQKNLQKVHEKPGLKNKFILMEKSKIHAEFLHSTGFISMNSFKISPKHEGQYHVPRVVH